MQGKLYWKLILETYIVITYISKYTVNFNVNYVEINYEVEVNYM